MKVKILDVEQVSAYSKKLASMNKRWRKYPMQIITTDKGVFIDHKIGTSGHWIGREYEIGTDYEYKHATNNRGDEVQVDTPTFKDNIWLRPKD